MIALSNKFASLNEADWFEATDFFLDQFRTQDNCYPRPARLQMLLEHPQDWPGMLERFAIAWGTHKLLK